MTIPRVSIQIPPGSRACGGLGGNVWDLACDSAGHTPFETDLENLKRRFASDESRGVFMETMREYMALAEEGMLPWDFIEQMQIAPDVLEIRFPDWWFSGGKMHVRLYYTEVRDFPGILTALRLNVKRPGPYGVEDQNTHALDAADLLHEFQERGFR